jgi:NAD(P)-dependent dehydrogenase (short-subunit alcohol dehydrogenase family)
MKFKSDIDIDFGDRTRALDLLDTIPASILRDGKLVKHNTGVYTTNIPVDPFTGQASIDYHDAEDRGYTKLDFLNVSLYTQIANEDQLNQLISQEPEWDRLYDILVKGQFIVSKAGIEVMRKQGFGGDIVNIVSKNAVVAGPNNPGYGSAKAAQAHLTRLMAAELGADKIRVNTVNPDAVISDSNIWSGGWAEGRAKAYGITVAELPAYYAKRTLLNEIILPDDIANACYAFVGGLLNKSTGNALNVDGGVSMGFYR